MPRPKGSKNIPKPEIEFVKQVIKVKDDPLLPNKSLFRVDEAADYFNCSQSTIKLWIENGHLEAEKYKMDGQIRGMIRIPRYSLLKHRFNHRFFPLL